MAGRRTKSLARKNADAPGVHARQLDLTKKLLQRAEGASVDDLAEHVGVSKRTAWRYIQALEAGDVVLQQEQHRDGRRTVWRILRDGAITVSYGQRLALRLCRGLLDFLAGTDLEAYLGEVLARLTGGARASRDRADRKLLVVTDAPVLLEGTAELVNDVVSALQYEAELRIRHRSVDRGQSTAVFDPYTLVVYKKALYVIGYSHHHAQIRTLAMDGFLEADWSTKKRFKYPDDYDPNQHVSGPFGLFADTPTEVRVRFTHKAARFVRRRRWHPSQRFRNVDGGVEMTMQLAGTQEFVSWLLEWGDQAELLSPPALRIEVAAQLERAAAQYRRAVAIQEELPLGTR
jgi:predicted DNA-binding transcriptional regulator YafY